MPIVKTETGNLLEMFKQAQVPPLLAHGTNCLKTMRGISAELAEEFPLPALYRLGDYSAIGVECGTILNFYTSLEVEGNFEYSALKSCLKKLSMEAINAGTYIQLTFPQINQPGVSWDIVKKILNSQEQLLITVVQHDKREVRMGEGEAEQAS